jgi:L-lysine 6-transaminase
MTVALERTAAAADVHTRLARHLLVDGFDLVLDLERSHGSWLVDARDGAEYLDLFTFFASSALGMNHPALAHDPAFRAELLTAALTKPSNSDVYTVAMARFVDTFARVLGDPALPHLFFIEGGAAAVENAVKVAFDWKSRWNEAHGLDPARGTRVLHLREAFHGRTGYTMSLTNTDPVKTARYPTFDWPRIDNPYLRAGVAAAEQHERELAALRQAQEAFAAHPHDIACAIVEPIQGEGGDHHFRPEFLRGLRRIADEAEVLLIFDEVQTGFGTTGRWWCFEHFGVEPDIVAFGKKTQVCGIAASRRLDLVDSVFAVPSRINSTWGGQLADMVRCRRQIEVIRDDGLLDHVTEVGARLLRGIERLAGRLPGLVTNPRGRGFFLAFDLPDPATRDRALRRLREHHLLALPTGRRGIRFRPPLILAAAEADEGLERCELALAAMAD